MANTNRPRCECCDEVLEELLTMRQNFEKLCHRLGSQIVELRREMRSMVAAPSSSNLNNVKEEAKKPRKQTRKSRSYCTESSPPPAPSPRKTTRRQRAESPEFDGAEDGAPKMKVQRTHNIKQEAPAPGSSSPDASIVAAVARSEARAQRPMLEFFGIKARVLPTLPFSNPGEFEDWEALLENDEDQRDQLRLELMQSESDPPDKFIKQIWSSILSDDVTIHYTYHGNAKTAKKPIKNYTFTAVFQEVFVQLFDRLDTSYFIERTSRFFNYCHDKTRRLNRLNRTRGDMDNMENILFETTIVDDQSQTTIDKEEEIFAE